MRSKGDEVGGHVEGEAVRRDPARDADADGADLARRPTHAPVEPAMRPAATP